MVLIVFILDLKLLLNLLSIFSQFNFKYLIIIRFTFHPVKILYALDFFIIIFYQENLIICNKIDVLFLDVIQEILLIYIKYYYKNRILKL